MGFELFCATMIALLVGMAITFGGYRLFMALLPLWGFIFGFGLGAQTMQALFGYGFLATTISWVIGFIVGAIFGVLSYLFYIFGVSILAGSLGYIMGVVIMLSFGVDLGFFTWLVGVVVGIALIVVTIYFKLFKYAVIVSTSVTGAGILVGTMMIGVVGVSLLRFFENPIRLLLDDSPWWTLLFLALVIGGIVVQLRAKPIPEIDEMSFGS